MPLKKSSFFAARPFCARSSCFESFWVALQNGLFFGVFGSSPLSARAVLTITANAFRAPASAPFASTLPVATGGAFGFLAVVAFGLVFGFGLAFAFAGAVAPALGVALAFGVVLALGDALGATLGVGVTSAFTTLMVRCTP